MRCLIFFGHLFLLLNKSNSRLLPIKIKLAGIKIAGIILFSRLYLPWRRHIVPAPDFEARRHYPKEDRQYQQGLKPLNDSNRIHTYTSMRAFSFI